MKIDPRRIKITTSPVTEPLTETEAKLHCRVDHSTEDDLFMRLIEVARITCEDISGRSFITRTYTAKLDCFPPRTFELPYPPLLTITSIKYTDSSGNQSTYSSANYIVDGHSEPGRVALKSGSDWPSVTLQDINGVEIIYTAGYGVNATTMPDQYKQAMLLLIGHLYENRESVVLQQGVSMVKVPQTVEWLLMMDRAF